MIPRVIEAMLKDLLAKPVDPDQRLALASQYLQEGSPLARRKTWDTINSFVAAANVRAQTLVNIEKREGWVTVLESFDFRYSNPSNNTVINAYVAQLLLSKAEEWEFPRFTFSECLDSTFGPRKLINGPYVLIREQPAKLILNPGTGALTAPAIFRVETRIVVRYEPQWLMEKLGLVEPLSSPDKAPPVLGRR